MSANPAGSWAIRAPLRMRWMYSANPCHLENVVTCSRSCSRGIPAKGFEILSFTNLVSSANIVIVLVTDLALRLLLMSTCAFTSWLPFSVEAS